MSLLGRIRKLLGGVPPVDGWVYAGVTNRLMDQHTWTDGFEKAQMYFMNGAPGHAGYVAEVDQGDVTRKLSNGFVRKDHALVLLDMYMSDEKQSPAAFMHSETAEDDYGMGDNMVRQDTWLREHAANYDFDVLDPSVVK